MEPQRRRGPMDPWRADAGPQGLMGPGRGKPTDWRAWAPRDPDEIPLGPYGPGALLPPSLGAFDHELALPRLAADQLPSALIGVILAGIFASSISTADSQVLSCSAILGGDLRDSPQQSVRGQKIATFIVIVIVALIATWAPANVFTLVILAWSALAAAFVPLAILTCSGVKMIVVHRLTIMISALGTFLICRQYGSPFGLNELLCAWLVAAVICKVLLNNFKQ